MHAEKSVVKISRSYKKFIRELSAIKNEMEAEAWENRIRTEGINEGLTEGREKGLAEGRAEGQREKLQIARNLLAEGSTPDFVQKITGLDLETITNLRN